MDIFLERYADIILRSALDLKAGDVLSINTEECNSKFAHLIANKARELTGNGSYIQLIEDGKVIDTEEAGTEFPINKKPTALLHLPTFRKFEEPDNDKVYSAPELQGFKLLSEPLYNPTPSIPYISAPIPNDEWEDMLDGEASSLLSELLSLEEDDYIERSISFRDIVRYEKEKLNGLHLKSGRITTEEGTDLSFKFLSGSEFASTFTSTTDERLFIPTIFASDIFRALDKNSLNGYLNITKPIMLFGKEARSLSIRFENGNVSEFSTDEDSGALFNLYLKQDKDAGKASMLSIVEENNPASFIDLAYLPDWDRMKSTSITLGGPRPEGIKEEAKTEAADSIVSLYLPIGSSSLIIECEDENGDEHLIVEDGILQEEE